MFISFGLGYIALNKFSFSLSQIEFLLLAILIGMGLLATGISLLGLLNILDKYYVFIYFCILSIILWRKLHIDPSLFRFKPRYEHRVGYFDFFLYTMIFVLLLISFMQTFTPAWDYDALMYHLEIPKQFINHGGIYFDKDIVRSAYPMLSQMLFSIGLIFQLESLPRLINFTYSLLWLGSVYAFSIRFFVNPKIALLAIGILVGTPSFAFWSNWAGGDFAWVVYEFWSIYALILCFGSKTKNYGKWVALSGLMAGYAASTKYLSLVSFLIVLFLLLIYLLRNKIEIGNFLKIVFIFGLSAGAVMSLWYLRNIFWTGNPVYPLVWGGPGWEPLEEKIWNDYVYSFGMPKTLLNVLLLPIHMYTYQSHFATTPVEIFHPILWLAVIFPLLRVSQSSELKMTQIYVFLYILYWVLSAHVIRFTLPFSAFLAVFAAVVVENFAISIKRINIMPILKAGFVGTLLFYSLFYQLTYIQISGLTSYYLGYSSKKDLLQNSVNNLSITLYITEFIPENNKVQFLWDGRGYYCDKRCIPDDEQSNAIILSTVQPQPEQLAYELKKQGITHLLLSLADAHWFIAYHDRDNEHKKALSYFEDIFLPACGKLVIQTNISQLYKIDCYP
jgi:hypothetical protein